MFKINDLQFKNETVLVSFDDFDILVLLDTYVQYSLKKDLEIDNATVDELLKEEIYANGYLAALRKLKYKDRTEKELRDYLNDNYKMDDKYLNRLIDDLISKGYINDESYASSYLENSLYQLKGKKLIKNELLKKGISEKLANETISRIKDEKDNAVKYGQRVLNSTKGKSERAIKQFVRQKLILRGYSYEDSDYVINNLEYSQNHNDEIELLKKVYLKTKNRYEKKNKYSDKELRNKIIQYLMNCGFKYEDINSVISEKEIDDE